MRSTCRRVFVVFLFLFLAAGAAEHAEAKDNWVRLKSANFVLVGNADQKKIRDIALKLEQYRYAFTQLLPTLKYSSSTPNTIMVFKDMKSFEPFRMRNAAGYFQPGPDVDYLALAADQGDGQLAYDVMFHEYTHLLIHNSRFSEVPDWFNEGLAEYYSTFEVSDDRKVKIGTIVPMHMYVLRQEKLLPLATLFAVDHESPYYNESKKQSIFYAQSWLLVHYLIQNNDGARLPQLGRFIDLLLNQTPAEDAFRQSFNMSFADMEKELQGYLKQTSHRLTIATFKDKLDASTEVAFEPLDEAAAQAYQGDLALHSRLKIADQYLQKALQLDPNQSRALVALGRYHSETGEVDKALPYLEKAVAVDARNPFALYFYGDALMRKYQSNLPAEQITKLRTLLKPALAIEPVNGELVRLYGYLSLFDRQELDPAIEQALKVLGSEPQRHELRFVLAQLYAAKGEYPLAKGLLLALKASGARAEIKESAQQMLASLERYLAQVEAHKEAARSRGQAPPPDSTSEVGGGREPGDAPTLRRRAPLSLPPLAEGETRIRGQMVAIECNGGNAVTLVIKTADRTVRINNPDLGKIKFLSYASQVAMGAEITCGRIASPQTVMATFTAPRPGAKNVEGTASTIIFINPEAETP